MLCQKQPNRSRRRGAARTPLVRCLFLALCAYALAANRQPLSDAVSYWRYEPSGEIARIAGRTGLNGKGRFLFYACRPELDGTRRFIEEFGHKESTASILGCYKDNRIYIYDVRESQLDGIREVTAVHEMLHAAYARLSGAEKANVDRLLETECGKLENTADMKTLLRYYEKAEPGERGNELHSIIGTQLANVGPELEKHYSRYFSDRQRVVALYRNYIGVFNRLDAQIKDLSDALNALTPGIQSARSEYDRAMQALNGDIADFNRRAAAGAFADPDRFHSERSLLVARADQLNLKKSAIDKDIGSYNALVAQYNSIAWSTQKLYDSINSSLAPAPAIH